MEKNKIIICWKCQGLSVLRMLENFMGEDKFSQGLQAYLLKHRFKNARTADLWDSLDTAFSGNGRVPEVMATWTQQMGFPVVHAKREADKIILRQERYLADVNITSNATESPFGLVTLTIIFKKQVENEMMKKCAEFGYRFHFIFFP